jgi:DNA-binding LacI/PurR family transcriptional regulator
LTQKLLELARTLKPGDLLPSQTELMRRHQVSDRTVLRSLDDLQRAGWIVRRHGVGTFVADPEMRRSEPPIPAVPTQSKTVAALVFAFGPFYQHCVNLLSVEAEAAGLALVCHHARHETSFEDALPLEALQPQGFVIFSYYMYPFAQRLLERGHRVVLVGSPPAGVYPQAPCVTSDQEYGGYEATQHLLRLGHRRIAYIAPDSRYPLEHTLRWQGHRRALGEAARRDEEVQATVVPLETQAAWRGDPARCATFFGRPDAPTGLLTWNDAEAVSLLHVLHHAAVRVPEDVSVVGFDALPVGAESIPPLTTVESYVGSQMRAVMHFLTQPTAPPPTQSVMIVPALVPRASSAPPQEKLP